MPEPAALEAAIQQAHARGDGALLAALYQQAGDGAAHLDAACFFWTQALVFSLEAGDCDRVAVLRGALARHGRDRPPSTATPL